MVNAKRIPLPALTRRLCDLADDGALTAAAVRRQAPELAAQVEADGTLPAVRGLWGKSRNVDEHAGTRIVHPEVLRRLGEIAGVPLRGDAVHAGFIHTYGYLLTNLRTPYGYKRTRWTSPVIERGLDLPRGVLRPYPRGGTLLANLTWVLGRVAFAPDSAECKRLSSLRVHIDPRLRQWAPIDDGQRLIETVRAGEDRLEIYTDLLPMNDVDPDAYRLLVYSLRRIRRGVSRHQLFTVFPISRPSFDVLREQAAGHASVRLRYNAYDPTLDARDWHGRRTWRTTRFAPPSGRR